MRNAGTMKWLILAGLLGGAAEVVWVGAYSVVTDISLSQIAGAIFTTFVPAGNGLALAPLYGLLIHMGLSVLLALTFGYTLWPVVERLTSHRHVALLASITTLALVWKFNFFVLLPVWNPEFIGLLPLGVTLISKLLFGVAMGAVLMMRPRRLV